MNDKYYIPQIEEFHIGFEFEFFDEDGKDWNPTKINHQSDLINWTGFYPESISLRVKLLDREGIESLGFTSCSYWINARPDYYLNGYAKSIKEEPTHRILLVLEDLGDKFIIHKIFMNNDCSVNYDKVLFNGKIKNKSELKTLLKQIEI